MPILASLLSPICVFALRKEIVVILVVVFWIVLLFLMNFLPFFLFFLRGMNFLLNK